MKPTVLDLAACDLRTRSDRIRNFVRVVHLCPLIRQLANLVNWQGTPEFFHFEREKKTIQVYSNTVVKTYTDGASHDRIDRLCAVYGFLSRKAVPYTDRLIHSKYSNGRVFLAPRGRDVKPQSAQEVIDAIRCILETLVVSHAEPDSLFHRDIRWPNIVQNIQNRRQWILVNWEDADVTPTRAATHLDPINHAPSVQRDGHGAEVDLWAVGNLILGKGYLPGMTQELLALGDKMTKVATAKEALEDLDVLAPRDA